MRPILFGWLIFAAVCACGETFAERYDSYGQLILTNLASAPFPHPDREKGHAYKAEIFTAEKNYSDNTVAIFIPKNMGKAHTVDFVIHFHGWRNSVTNVLRRYELIEQLAASGRKAILVVPQGPLNAADSFDGKLEDPGGFDRFLEEVLAVVRQDAKLKEVKPGNIILSGHSGGYQVISSIVAQTNKFPVREVWLFDALYGRTEKFMNWFHEQPEARMLNIYTENGGTKSETQKLMKDLQENKTAFASGDDKSISDEALRTNQLAFIYTDLPHDDVIHKRATFERFLRASSIGKTPNANSAEIGSNAVYFRSDSGLAGTNTGSLPDQFDAPTKLRWRTRVDSGQSSPILSNGRIFLTTYRAVDRELATVAIDQKSGEVLWKQKAPAERIEELHPTMGNPAAATPACDGERVFVFFGSYGLICYDLDGRKLWEHVLDPFRDEYGASSSPIIVDGKIILCEDHDIDSFLIALDTRTGKVIWKTSRPDAVRSYATPVVWTTGGQKQLLVAGALELAGYNPANGEKLWWVNGLARIVIPAPVPVGDTIYMASWAPGGDAGAKLTLDSWKIALEKWDKNSDGKLSRNEVTDHNVLERYFRMDLDQNALLDQSEWERHAAVFSRADNAALAIKPSGRGDLTDKAVLWKYRRGVPYVATPLVKNGVLWMVKDGGIVTRLDTASGRMLSEERLPGVGGYCASPVAGDGKIYFASEGGVVSVVADEPVWRIISSHKFDGKIYGTPILNGNCIFVRAGDSVYCYEGESADK